MDYGDSVNVATVGTAPRYKFELIVYDGDVQLDCVVKSDGIRYRPDFAYCDLSYSVVLGLW